MSAMLCALRFITGIAPTAMAFGCIYIIGMALPWFLPETVERGQ